VSAIDEPARKERTIDGAETARALVVGDGGFAIGDGDMQSVQFKNRDIVMAGHLYRPNDFKDGARYPAIVCVHPGGGVKEQTAGVYARRLADQGFVTLAYDSSYQGASGGTPHFLDEPMNRVADVYSAVDYLTTLSFVEAERIGVLGICAGGGMAVKAASVDRRIKAVGTASAVNVGTATRKGWEGKGSEADLLVTLEAWTDSLPMYPASRPMER
jgi:fermentation-respiration switch protein FrsA (DUF1100 family)